MEHMYKDVQIKPVCESDAYFLHLLMNDPPVLQRLNEVPTQQQNWIDAINEWSCDDDEEDYATMGEPVPFEVAYPFGEKLPQEDSDDDELEALTGEIAGDHDDNDQNEDEQEDDDQPLPHP